MNALRPEQADSFSNYRALHPHADWILLAAEDRESRSMIARRLRHEGFEVFEAASATDLLGRIGSPLLGMGSTPGLIISDVGLDGLPESMILQRLRSYNRQVPFILIADRRPKSVPDGLVKRAKAVLRKPLDLDRLIAVVRSLLADGSVAPHLRLLST